ncbi:MAG TPA: serine/threonine-protein kinase [Polyangiaceae bacterium]|jgi:serine/threonine-protein kinase
MTDDKHASFAATALAEPVSGTPIVNASSSGTSPTAPASAEMLASGPVGRTIHGRYRIKRLVGEGGMGGVYEAEHLEIGKRVAVKLVHSLHARDPHVAARIKQEARSTSAVESEHIVQVFDAGEDEQLGIFLVMEFLKGEDLGSLLARKKRVSPMAAATMVVQAAQGLARAHAAGIIHRDLKPANIFLTQRDDGTSLVKLVDFGIAKLVRDAKQAQGGPGLTRSGMVIGTPQYMSPEQAQGLLTVDHRTDIYSLGAALFEAIVGHSPFAEMPTYEQTILQIMTRPVPRIAESVPEIHPELDRLCADMMARDPAARPADMLAVRERLIRIFPEIDGGRLPMRSLTNEMAFDATVAADASGEMRAQRDAAFVRAGLSGVGARVVVSPATQSGVAVEQSSQPVSEAPGVPRRRNGALIGVVAVVAMATGILSVALLKMTTRSESSATPSAPSAGLVQSVVAAPPPPAPPPPPAQTLGAPVPRAGHDVVQVPQGPARAAAPADKSRPPHATRPPRPAVAAAPASAAPATTAKPQEKDPNERPVGGTGMSTEF